MDVHSAVLGEMIFCRGVNSFLTYRTINVLWLPSSFNFW